jgi:hypothetical protein
VGIEPTIPVFERAKTVHALDCAATVIGQVKVNDTLQLAVYRQSVRLGIKPLEIHDQIFFFSTEPLR